MKVIFIQTVPGTGVRGEIREVKDGFAMNFLLPGKKAVVVTDKNLKLYSKIKEEREIKVKNVQDPRQLAARLKSVVLTFSEKADMEGTFFAGITKDKVAQELETKNFKLKAKQIKLEQPIKKAGEYKVEIELIGGVKSEIKIITKEKK